MFIVNEILIENAPDPIEKFKKLENLQSKSPQ